jgi:hypothetical protein
VGVGHREDDGGPGGEQIIDSLIRRQDAQIHHDPPAREVERPA